MRSMLEVVKCASGLSIQDAGRVGWKRFGLPPGGAMDQHAMREANHLVGNRPDAPVIELLFGGATFRVLRDLRVGIAGAAGSPTVGTWRSVALAEGDEFTIDPPTHGGLWTYLALEGGVFADTAFGSASAYPRAGLGRVLKAGDTLATGGFTTPWASSTWPGARTSIPETIWDYHSPPALRILPAPQTEDFTPEARRLLVDHDWTVSPQSDRTGYRLEGPTLDGPAGDIQSEPVVVGSIQVPPGGQPIVTLRDGPTVGGYPKIAVIHSADLDRFVQCAPGSRLRFRGL